jgi:hypothetical protein
MTAKDVTQPTDVDIQGPETRFRRLSKKWLERMTLEADGAPCLDGRGGDLVHALWLASRALGSERAEVVREEEYLAFYTRTGRCPTCGDHGLHHQQCDLVGPDFALAPFPRRESEPLVSAPAAAPRPKSRARSRAA